MPNFTIESESGTEQIESENAISAAGKWAAKHAGFDSDEPCWDPFSFTVNGIDFAAELTSITNHGGTILVANDETEKLFNQLGEEV